MNWQEREIQDWFGLEPVGHPNPRRVALHDHWPDVHPLRKNFPIDRFLFVRGLAAFLHTLSQECGIEFETIELVFDVVNDLQGSSAQVLERRAVPIFRY